MSPSPVPRIVTRRLPASDAPHRITTDEIAAIIALRDPVQRNLRITLAYHDIALAMREWLGGDIVWTGFATWASRIAGRFVRGELLPIGRSYVNTLVRLPIRRISGAVSRNAMEGNLSVFADIAPVFARLLAELARASEPADVRIERLVAALEPGPTEAGGQDLLILAARNYWAAVFEPDAKRRAELVLLANNQVGFHEQIRLQRYIYACLNAPILPLVPERVQRSAPRGLIDRILGSRIGWLQAEWASLATRWLMRMDLPTETLRLGSDLPPLRGVQMFPEALRALESVELRAFLYQVDRTPNTTSGSAAGDWSDIGERMNFIVDLFRTRQQDATLFDPPFTPSQIAVIRSGGIPRGDL